MAEIKLTEANFEEEVLKSYIPVLVAEENEGKIEVGKVNIDEEVGLANAFQIQVIPTLVAVKNGQIAGVMKGLRDKADILAMFQ